MYRGRRDMELIRKILLVAGDIQDINWTNYDFYKFKYHFELLTDEGYLEGEIRRARMDDGHLIQDMTYRCQLTWKGQDFLALVADELVWNEIKSMAGRPFSLSEVDISGAGEVRIGGSVAGRDINFIVINESNWEFLRKIISG